MQRMLRENFNFLFMPSCGKAYIYSTLGSLIMIDFSQKQLWQVRVGWKISVIIILSWHVTSITHTGDSELPECCISECRWLTAAGRIQPHWPVAWGHVESGRRWRGFPWAMTPGRAEHPSPWRCRWRRWSWPACHRTTPAYGAPPGGCHSLTWTWKCSAEVKQKKNRKTENVKGRMTKKKPF